MVAHMKKIVVIVCSFVLLAISSVWPAAFKDTIDVAVTFYDFHSDQSNPEFETMPSVTPNGTAWKNMVDLTLDSLQKPKLGSSPYFNLYIAKWFRPWTKGDSTIPNYGPYTGFDAPGNDSMYSVSNAAGATPKTIKIRTDTAFKNVVIHDTLLFSLVQGSQGTYTFSDQTFFPLDDAGFGLEGRNHNFAYTMELHREFTMKPGLIFQFTGDDDVWVFINKKLAMDLGGRHGPVSDTVFVDSLGLTNGKKYSFDFFYCERHTTGATIKITTNIITSDPAILKMTAEPDIGIIQSGDSIKFIARVFDDTGAFRPEFNPSIEWSKKASNPNSTSYLRFSSDSLNIFKGITAYDTVTIISTFKDPTNPLRILQDTATVIVIPGPPYRVVIESDTIPRDKNTTDRLGSIAMDSARNYDTVYAILYDKNNNFIGPDTNPSWSSRKTTCVTVNPVPGKKCAGNIHRETRDFDSTFVLASHTGLLPDSVNVILQTGNIVAIRLVTFIGDTVITSIAMNTDQQKNVKIQVQWSNAIGKWVDESGAWTLNPSTLIRWDAPQPPQPGSMAASWILNPATDGDFTLTVSRGIRSAVIPVSITIAPPSKVTLRIISPLDSIIAGVPFRCEVLIENTDGPVPREWCVDATYRDSLDNSKKPAFTPTIVLSSPTTPSTVFDVAARQCFTNGLDTIKTVLYYAPYFYKESKDSLHLFTVNLSGNVIGNPLSLTNRFRLLPGPLDSISLENAYLKAMPGPITLTYPDSSTIIYSSGFDHYGNRIGFVSSNWKTDGTLHRIPPPDSGVFRIYYQASDVNESGYITASVLSEARPSVMLSDNVQIINIGGLSVIESAVTQDVNGNGYLDRIVITFTKEVILPADFQNSDVSVIYDKKPFTFIVERVEGLTGDTGSVFTVYLKDTAKTIDGLVPQNAVPQTDWLPLLTIKNLAGINAIQNQRCRDGAGPVIWKVLVTRNKVDDRTRDLVAVTFSEAVKSGGITGDAFSTATSPDVVFNVYKISNNVVDTQKTMLDSITTFYQMPDSVTLTFFMTNRHELMNYHFFNITDKNQIADKSRQGMGNLPVILNQKVRVEVVGKYGDLSVGPNPLIPTLTSPVAPGDFIFANEPNGVTWVKNHGGAIFRFLISPGQGTISGTLNVYDVVGNLVTSTTSNKNLALECTARSTADSSVCNYDIYWNGTTSKKMKAAPGVYVGVLYLSSTNPKGETDKRRQYARVGVAR